VITYRAPRATEMSRVGSLASEADPAMGSQKRLGGSARRACLTLGLVIMFLTVGVPRWLAGDVTPPPTHAGAGFAKLCRDRGGTPAVAPHSGNQSFCTIRYGRHVYRMDAITPDGFDDDTAHFQRQGCIEANRAAGHRRRSFVYHPTTGVCERRA
jgi:hypothetical protein